MKFTNIYTIVLVTLGSVFIGKQSIPAKPQLKSRLNSGKFLTPKKTVATNRFLMIKSNHCRSYLKKTKGSSATM